MKRVLKVLKLLIHLLFTYLQLCVGGTDQPISQYGMPIFKVGTTEEKISNKDASLNRETAITMWSLRSLCMQVCMCRYIQYTVYSECGMTLVLLTGRQKCCHRAFWRFGNELLWQGGYWSIGIGGVCAWTSVAIVPREVTEWIGEWNAND